MFIHIEKIVAHARDWVQKQGHALDSALGREVESLLSHVAEKSQEEFAAEMLQQKGYTVIKPTPPVEPANDPPQGGALKLVLPKVDEPAPGTVKVDETPPPQA